MAPAVCRCNYPGNCILVFLCSSYLMQWAAVMTQLAAIRDPPQVCLHSPSLSYCREICGGNEVKYMVKFRDCLFNPDSVIGLQNIWYPLGLTSYKQMLCPQGLPENIKTLTDVYISIPARASCGAWHLLHWPHEKSGAQWVGYHTQGLKDKTLNLKYV